MYNISELGNINYKRGFSKMVFKIALAP